MNYLAVCVVLLCMVISAFASTTIRMTSEAAAATGTAAEDTDAPGGGNTDMTDVPGMNGTTTSPEGPEGGASGLVAQYTMIYTGLVCAVMALLRH